MHELDGLSREFESHRGHMRAVAHRILGSMEEAEDAVQGAWLRLAGADSAGIDNLGGWLTTAVVREALDLLRARSARREQSWEAHIPDALVTRVDSDPETSAILADAVAAALQVVLDSLSPAERVAFVLHDVFAVPFDEIAHILERSPESARQLASRARRRVREGQAAGADPQRPIVDAFFAAAREGDLEALLATLDPELVLRVDGEGGETRHVAGADAVAHQAMLFADPDRMTHPILIDGRPGVVVTGPGLSLLSVMSFDVREGKIVSIDALTDPDRLRDLDLPPMGSGGGAE